MTIRIVLSREDTLHMGTVNGGAQRIICPITSGFLKGEGFDAVLVQGGSDWISVDSATGTAYLDIRTHFRDRQSGDVFYVQAKGISRVDEKVQLVMAWNPDAKTTKGGDHYAFSTPTFEVSGEKHKWMERTAFVGQGHWEVPGDGTQAVEQEIYRLVAG